MLNYYQSTMNRRLGVVVCAGKFTQLAAEARSPPRDFRREDGLPVLLPPPLLPSSCCCCCCCRCSCCAALLSGISSALAARIAGVVRGAASCSAFSASTASAAAAGWASFPEPAASGLSSLFPPLFPSGCVQMLQASAAGVPWGTWSGHLPAGHVCMVAKPCCAAIADRSPCSCGKWRGSMSLLLTLAARNACRQT